MSRNKQEHTKILEYLIENNGEKLRFLDDDLVLHNSNYSNVKEREHYKSLEEFMGAIFDDPYYPLISTCDLACFNEKNDSLVILELKTEKANYTAFGQILYYLLHAESVKIAHGREVKNLEGIILAPEIDKSLKELVEKYKGIVPEISLKEYEKNDDGQLLITDVV
jgi:RecB family endonuclease NucS